MSQSHAAPLPNLRREWVIEGIRSPAAQTEIERVLALMPQLRYARITQLRHQRQNTLDLRLGRRRADPLDHPFAA